MLKSIRLQWAATALAALLVPCAVRAQIPEPPKALPSPNASMLSTFADFPVSTFTGTPEIAVNLYTLSDPFFTIPISLKYDPSGVRPNVHPGWTGMNFGLSTNYAIVRTVKDGPDDAPDGISSEYQRGWLNGSVRNGLNYQASDWTSTTKLQQVANSSPTIDTEPDEYNFSAPGFSGSFYLAHDGQWKVKCDKPVVVEVINSAIYPPFTPPSFTGNPWYIEGPQSKYQRHVAGFVVVDDDGTRYEYGTSNAYCEYSLDFFEQGTDTWICNSWYLKSITKPTGQVVNFEYVRGDFVAQMYFSVYNKFARVNGGSGFGLNFSCENWSSLIGVNGPYDGKLISPIYLKEIKGSNFQASFTATVSSELPYSEDVFSAHFNQNPSMLVPLTYLYDCFYPTENANSCDFNTTLATLLTKLKWKKLDNIQIKNGGGTIVKEFNFTYNNTATARLRLDKVQEKSGYNNTVLPPYEFSYNAPSGFTLPGYAKSHNDHWGFNNGKLMNLTDFDAMGNYGSLFRTAATDKRFYLTGSLASIKYPTGGVTKFWFEPHTYSKAVKLVRWQGVDLFESNSTAGGLRIKEIHNYDAVTSQIQKRKFYYLASFNPAAPDTSVNALSSGILGVRSVYYFPEYKPKPADASITVEEDIFSSISLLAGTENSHGSHVGYSNVIEWTSAEGWTIHKFTNFDNGYGDEQPNAYIQPSSTSYIPFTDNSFKRGKPVEISRYFQNGNLASKQTFQYSLVGDVNPNAVRGVKTVIASLCQSDNRLVYEATAYTINTQDFLPLQEITYTYDQDTPSRSTFFSRVSSYRTNGQVAGVLQTDSKTNPTLIPLSPLGPSYDRQIQTLYKYPGDFSSPSTDAISIDMTTKNMIGAPVEITKRLVTIPPGGTPVGYSPLNWQKVTYNVNRLPAKVESKLGDASTSVTEYEFLTYDNRGNLLTYWDKSGTTTKLEYYGVTDVGKTDLIKSRTTADGSTIPQTTTYDHKPLVGISRITDPNGKVIDYEYDNFNRLEFVKSGGLARASYCYNYAGQTVKCTALAPKNSIAAGAPALIPDDALPVTLVEFTARKAEQTALIQWSTTTETNSKLFEIQRSSDGRSWATIGTVDAKGESNELQRYSFSDLAPVLNKPGQTPQAENLYRLKMIDLDETFAYSRIQSLIFASDGGVSLFPNPITIGSSLNIAIDDISTIKAVKIYDSTGRMVQQSGPASKISTNMITPGLYVVEITYKDGSITTHRVVKQ